MKKTLTLALTLFALAACGTKDDNKNTTNDNNNGGQSTNPVVVGELLGTWSKPCTSAGSQGGFVKNSITVETTTATMLTQAFQSSTDCSGTADFESRSNLNYVIPTFSAPAVNQINMTVNSIKARFNTEAAVALANGSSFCGFTDWAVGAEKEVSGRNCVADLPSAGQPYYDIFKLESPNLFVGQVDSAHSGKTPETRPTQLETTPYTR